MPKKRPSEKVSVTFRISTAAAKKWKSFCRDYSGTPLYIRPGELGEKALMAEVDRQMLILSGAFPEGRASGRTGDDVQHGARRRPINAAT